jgi:hypothetical protein
MSCRYTLLDTAVIANPIEMACCTASDEPEQGLDGDLIFDAHSEELGAGLPDLRAKRIHVLEGSEFDSGGTTPDGLRPAAAGVSSTDTWA